MGNRINVEEVWKDSDGEYRGMHSGMTYHSYEVEKIGPFYWTKPAHGADVNELDTVEMDQDSDVKQGKEKY